jgi:hypothetical protein
MVAKKNKGKQGAAKTERAATAAKEKPSNFPAPEKVAADWRNQILDFYKMANLEDLLGALLFEELKTSAKDFFAEVRAIAVDRIRISFKMGEIDSGDYDIPYIALNCIRTGRLNKLCPIWE